MEEGKGGESARASPSFVSVGGRQRFTVGLRPGETTIVSWKKLVKDASKAGLPASVPEPPSNAHPALESRLSPGQTAENEVQDAQPTSRFSAVIEKIERLYMGKHSSDEEDLNDVPDDDEYDTEDSFIDDTELDEYFQVDNSAIKHDGFFVNRGKLERINEPTSLPNQQPKKRRRKDVEKGLGEGDDGHMPNKPLKAGKKASGKSVPMVVKNITVPSHVVALPSVQNMDMRSQTQMNSSVISAKSKSAETKASVDPTPPSKVSNGDASLFIAVEKDIGKQKTGIGLSVNQGNKLKDGGEISDAVQMSHDKSSHAQCKSLPGKLSNNVDEFHQTVQCREKDGTKGRPDLNVPMGKYSAQTLKAPLTQRKEGSGARPKSTMLEKAIRELEKMVADSRPPAMEAQDADISAQAVKRRLPREVKQKLAKVARVAAIHGKISKELLNRLMGILGHMMQLRTLKRNLKDMINMGLSAKKEKDDRFQQMKKEVAELIRLRVPYIMSKALEQQAGASDDFQEIGNEEKEVIKRKCSIDDVLEDKICDLYDLYVEGLDEDAGPQVRKLYAELASLWPDGFMDNHGIKRAICRAKDRKRALYRRHKEQQKIKRKKLLIPKTEDGVRPETTSVAQQQYTLEKLVSDSNNHGSTSVIKPVPSATATNVAVRLPSSSVSSPHLEWPKLEKATGSSSNPNDARTMVVSTKKKVKRKPELELGVAPGEERHKSRKQVASLTQKPSLPVAAPPSKPSLPVAAPPHKPSVPVAAAPPQNFEQAS